MNEFVDLIQPRIRDGHHTDIGFCRAEGSRTGFRFRIRDTIKKCRFSGIGKAGYSATQRHRFVALRNKVTENSGMEPGIMLQRSCISFSVSRVTRLASVPVMLRGWFLL